MKPGTLSYNSVSKSWAMMLTNLKHDIEVLYKGSLNFETKEGETIIITGYFPNADDKQRMIATSFMTNHSMEVENWDCKNFIYISKG